jgi:N6-L-threonylcarbamoyladenine synthase
MKNVSILALETTCDETSIAITKGKKIISNLVYSQIKFHEKYKGVVPEIASRAHSEKIYELIKKEKKHIKNVNAIAFSRGPGLKGSLLIGRVAAETLSKFLEIPLMGINHLEGHLSACELIGKNIEKIFKFPLIALIVSGGHSELWLVKNYGIYKKLGSTRDDAAGEAFDKVAKLLGLPYPGGPMVEIMAKKAKKDSSIFTVPDVKNGLDFSFSGLKTQVAYYIRDKKKLTYKDKIEVCASFQKACVNSLLKKTIIAADKYKPRQIAICGGVSANGFLRRAFADAFSKKRIDLLYPQKEYCTDNAAMVAVCAYRKLEQNKLENNIEIDSNLEI